MSIKTRRPGHRSRSATLALILGLVGTLALAGALPRVALAQAKSQVAADSPYGIWADTDRPTTVADDESRSTELGMRFTTSASGSILSIRFYRSAGNTGPHRGRLWDEAGRLLGSVNFSDTKQIGWVRANFGAPIPVRKNGVYTVSYSAPNGRYASDQFELGSGRQISTGDLTGLQGVYSYDGSLPTTEWNASNYYVDVLFQKSSDLPTATTLSTHPTGTTSAPPSASTTTRSATPSATPTSATSRPSQSSSASGIPTFPSAGNTGASGVLTKYTGPAIVTRVGQVIENVEINSRLTIKADNVTLRNVRIQTGDYWVVLNYGSGTLIENSTLIGGAGTQASVGDIDGGSFTGRRLDVSGAADGLKIGSRSKVHDSYIHDLASFAGAHNDGIEVTGGQGVELLRNTILNGNSQTSAIFLDDFTAGVTANVLVQGNLIAGGGYSVYGGAPEARGVQFVGNFFSTRYFPRGGSYGPVAYWVSGSNTWTGNVWSDGPLQGRAVAP